MIKSILYWGLVVVVLIGLPFVLPLYWIWLLGRSLVCNIKGRR